MTKKPRQKPKARKPRYEIKQEFINCCASGCPNIISYWVQPAGYSGPVYCVLHRETANAR